MYTRSAAIYDKLYHFKDYATEVSRVHGWIQAFHPDARTLLDVGCATGRHLEYLQRHYAAEGLDLNEELLTAARRRCPDVRFHVGDMRNFSLSRRYDVVSCLFSAVACAAHSQENLVQVLRTFANHLAPGGLVIVEPWFTPETYWTRTITANVLNEEKFKLAWMYHSTRRDDVAVLDIQYLVGTPDLIDHFTERHELGLFSDEAYRAAFHAAGLPHVRHDPNAFGRGMFFGRRDRPW